MFEEQSAPVSLVKICWLCLSMADSVASPLVDAVCHRLDFNSYAIWKNKHFKQLRLQLAEIQNLLRDHRCSSSDHNSPLRLWLTNLRDLVYDVDILIDNCERSKKSKSVSFLRSFVSNFRIDQEVRRINDRLNWHLRLFQKFVHGHDAESGVITQVGFALSDECFSFERELEFSNILNTILTNNDEDSKLLVIPIVGMSGNGKTDLARRIYYDEKVVSHFQFMTWVSVGENLDLATIAEAIVGEYARNDSKEVFLDPSGVLGGKRFLIVLDDVWDDDSEKWEEVKSWLNVGDLGSCVLVTTRSSRVATLMGTVPAQHLAYLSDEDCWEKHARGHDVESSVVSPHVGFALSDECFSFGREFEFSNILNKMLSNEEGSILHVIPIVGMGGIGKTDLARRIYNDEKVISHFQFRTWIYVGENLDLATIAKAIVGEYARNDSKEDFLDPSGVLEGKKFLIVLDDVWDDDSEKWEKVKSWLNAGDLGSCVLVTTRSSRVATLMGTVPEQHLACLSDEDSWALFKCFAFGYMEDENKELVEIGHVIVAKCKGLPLAVKTIGGLLFTKTREVWLSIAHNDLWKVSEFRSQVLPVLKRSYDHLPSYVKQCFVFSSIFPQDYWIDRENLVQLWIAEGFIRLEVGNKGLEDVAYDYYFMELSEHSFFHEIVRDDFGEVVMYRMHDFMHDLARLVAGFEYSIESIKDSPIIPGHVQDCSVIGNFEQLVIQKKEKLRTLLLLSGKLENLCILFDGFSRLRVLDLSQSGITELPISIGALRHLRYLNLSHTYIRRIPESICKLKQLQTLELSNCYNLEELPKAIPLLRNLRHLGIESCCSLTHMPQGIGKLRFLKYLPAFILGKSSNSANLRELNSLDLGGRLDIKSLENVKNVVDARQARLQEKLNIQSLELSWSCNTSERAEISAQVIEFLRPPPYLKALDLKGYRGSVFPSWMNSRLPYLVKVSLINCSCQELPPLGQLPNLKDLYLKGLSAVQIIGLEFYGNAMVRGFPSLQQLELYNMPNLLEWKSPTMEETNGLTRIQTPFPCLETLIVEGCSKLTVLPFISNLKNLALCNSNVMLLHSLPNLPSLPSLLIDNFQEPVNHLTGDCGNSNSIIKLTIHECENLDTLFEVVQSFSSLRHLTILNCNSLDSLPMSLKMFNFLEKFEIVECPRLVYIPDILHRLSLLEEMNIEGCPLLKLLPESIKFLSFHQKLVIRRCPELERQLQRETTDADTLGD